MVPDLAAFHKPVRYVLLAVLVLGPISLVIVVLVGVTSSPSVVVEATVVDARPSEADVYTLSEIPEDSPLRPVVLQAFRAGSAEAEVKTEQLRFDGFPTRGVYNRHDGRFVKVTVDS